MKGSWIAGARRLAWAVSLGVAGTGVAAMPGDYRGKPFSDEFHRAGPPNIPGIVQCALYDLGGEGVAYHDTTPENEGSDRLNRQTAPYNHQRVHAGDSIGHFRPQEGVDLSFVKDWADLNHTNAVNPPINQFYIGWASDGEWVNDTVNVREPGTYAVKCLYTYSEKEVHRDANGQRVGDIRFDLRQAGGRPPPSAGHGRMAFLGLRANRHDHFPRGRPAVADLPLPARQQPGLLGV